MGKSSNIKHSYYSTFLIIYKCFSFNKYLLKHHSNLLDSFDADYKKRVINSGVRCGSLMYVLSKVLKIPFKTESCLITGMCAALFDDLIDEGHESINDIEKIVQYPDDFQLQSELGSKSQTLYLKLLQYSSEWQQKQLIKNIVLLLNAERIALSGEDAQWEERGMASFKVFTTVMGVREEDLNFDVALKFGKYLQALDDYEDIDYDPNEINLFRTYNTFDISKYYLEELKPILPRLFSLKDYDFNELFSFVETYHVYAIALHKYKHQEEGILKKYPMAFIRNTLSLSSKYLPF